MSGLDDSLLTSILMVALHLLQERSCAASCTCRRVLHGGSFNCVPVLLTPLSTPLTRLAAVFPSQFSNHDSYDALQSISNKKQLCCFCANTSSVRDMGLVVNIHKNCCGAALMQIKGFSQVH